MTTPNQPATRTTGRTTTLLIAIAILLVVVGIPALVAAGPLAVILGATAITIAYLLTGRWTR
ncbi:hypothetical protein EDF35_1902 [Rathayibacter sp. PhB151]|uniref:hypothetical protein n=1 Tax=Rathayibacter sp. PhB151 TaxID=2485189 RepID=UPI001063626C|nr:hypothetical protein [Rathayibacter sp. PhB151]TDX78688.1 hypothetical protein EDF35_1902 [Rathayibacter sp. PhB151]